jgi:hypothetical protein
MYYDVLSALSAKRTEGMGQDYNVLLHTVVAVQLQAAFVESA